MLEDHMFNKKIKRKTEKKERKKGNGDDYTHKCLKVISFSC